MGFEAVNRELEALAEAYAGGSMAPSEYRRQRRQLICQAIGEQPPEVQGTGEGEETHPGIAPVTTPEPRHAEGESAAAMQPAAGRRLYRALTGVTILIALGGVAGLLWFVFGRAP